MIKKVFVNCSGADTRTGHLPQAGVLTGDKYALFKTRVLTRVETTKKPVNDRLQLGAFINTLYGGFVFFVNYFSLQL